MNRLEIIEEPTSCPRCGSTDLGVFTAGEEDAADLVECEVCKWTAPLTVEGLEALRSTQG
jgi:transcription elongation factor Elf1